MIKSATQSFLWLLVIVLGSLLASSVVGYAIAGEGGFLLGLLVGWAPATIIQLARKIEQQSDKIWTDTNTQQKEN